MSFKFYKSIEVNVVNARAKSFYFLKCSPVQPSQCDETVSISFSLRSGANYVRGCAFSGHNCPGNVCFFFDCEVHC